MKVVTAEQMRRIEDRSEALGVSKDALMEAAGLAITRRIRRQLAPLTGVPVLLLIGPGNNGGDGLVTARHLHRWGARVSVYICCNRRTPDPKLDIVRGMGVPVITASSDTGLAQLRAALGRAHMVVDAVLGIGSIRPIDGLMRDILVMLAKSKSARPEMCVLAVDVPSGMDADTGAADAVCPAADITLSMGYPKVGHYAYGAASKIGSLEVVDIGLPEGVDNGVPLSLLTAERAKSLLPNRPAAAHKGSFGRAMVVAGSLHYIGAAYLAATAATRTGSGLVTLAVPDAIHMAVASKSVEPTYLPLRTSPDGILRPDAACDVLDALDGYSALLLGCGMGQAEQTQRFIEGVLCSGGRLPPTVVDADGLNTLAKLPNWWQRFTDDVVLTPHPGEMARLSGKSVGEVQSDRIGIATESAVRWNKVVVLKGAHSVVAFPDGSAVLSQFVNPGLASAGTGDVLAGSIAGLMSQDVSVGDAALLGVYLHGLAGDRVRSRLGDMGMVAGDLLPEFPLAVRALREGDAG